MEKVAIASTASKYLTKRLVEDYDRAQGVLSEARNHIAKGFEDLKEDQYDFADKNGIPDVNGSEILEINGGGS